MTDEGIFKAGGALLIFSGALLLFYWIVAFLEGFGPDGSTLPAAKALTSASGMGLLKNILITIGAVIFSIALILGGAVFVKIPKVVSIPVTTDVEKKVNKLQLIVWRILQHVKQQKQA